MQLALDTYSRILVNTARDEIGWMNRHDWAGGGPGAAGLRARAEPHSDAAGEATVTATDDAGNEYGPLTLALGPRAVVGFNSSDLESGNTDKGLSGATGMGTGGWRLAMESETLDIEALAYMRTGAGGEYLAS